MSDLYIQSSYVYLCVQAHHYSLQMLMYNVSSHDYMEIAPKLNGVYINGTYVCRLFFIVTVELETRQIPQYHGVA
jgi:hypothetical protein